jgi:hypothetical protein
MKKQGERDLVRSLPFIQVGLANGLGKLFSNISKSDLPNDTPNSLDMERTRPHAIPESDGKSTPPLCSRAGESINRRV